MSTTNAKHTPGPWRVGYSDGSGPYCIVRDCDRDTKGPGLVAYIGFHGDPELRGDMTPEERANAALIAQAPTMYARIAELEAQLARVTAERDHALDAMSGAADLLDAKDGTPHARVVRGVRESLLAALRACENGGAK